MATRIAIIGTGAIGTSLGLALRNSSNTSFEVIGHDKEYERATEAQKRGAFDSVEWNLIETVSGANVIWLALPTAAIRPTLEAVQDDLPAGVVVTDTADVKQPVLEWADELLPANAHFIGGNPMVRSDGFGVDAGHADLFAGKRYGLTPSAGADQDAVDFMVRLVELIGAKPLFLDPMEHDSLAAGVRHLPALLGVALLQVTTESSAWREMATMAGPVYESMTRLPSDDTEELREFFLSNRASLQRWVDTYEDALQELTTVIESGDEEAIDRMLAQVSRARRRWEKSEAAYRAEEGGRIYDDDSGTDEVGTYASLTSILGLGGIGRKPGKKKDE